jgi:hypothetical protein
MRSTEEFDDAEVRVERLRQVLHSVKQLSAFLRVLRDKIEAVKFPVAAPVTTTAGKVELAAPVSHRQQKLPATAEK